MGSILVFVQSHGDKVLKGSLAALTAAHELKKLGGRDKIVALTLGPGASAAATSVAAHGVDEVLFCEDAGLEPFRPVVFEQAIVQAAKAAGAEMIVGLASSIGKDVFPRVAARFEAAQASDIIGVNADGSFKRLMYAGNVIADVELTAAVKVVTVRGTAFAPATASGSTVTGGAPTKALAVTFDLSTAGEVLGKEDAKSERPELTDAEIVVSGGRALGSAENFEKVLSPLAEILGAAIGASRAAVDSGYAPNDWQVGQTGKVVAPQLYLAIGVSGAIQHLAGMKESKTIVAINKDPDAPIFEVADYGVVGDLFQLVPALVEQIKKVRS